MLVLACPPRDCWNREGPRWLGERMYNEREAELQARVPRNRVRLAYAGAGETAVAVQTFVAFSKDVAALGAPAAEHRPEPVTACDPVDPAVPV